MLTKEQQRCRKKFLRFFPGGFKDETYYAWERGYKWEAHLAWKEQLNRKMYEMLLAKKKYAEIAQRAVKLETKTNLLFSFEKMALRDAVRPPAGAKAFALGLFEFVYGKASYWNRFEHFTETLAALPRRQTRVLTWPLQTVFGFLADPQKHIFLKPRVTQVAAEKYGYDFHYTSRPNRETYESLLGFAEQIRADMKDLKPADMIDLQSFMWVMGSDEYA